MNSLNTPFSKKALYLTIIGWVIIKIQWLILILAFATYPNNKQ